MSAQHPRPRPGGAEVELIAQWGPEGLKRYRPGRPVRLDPRLCTWVHTRLPEVDAAGRRTTRTNWDPVHECLRRFGLPLPESAHQSALGSPLSDKPEVLTALGASVVRASDNLYGSRRAIRLARIALVPVTANVLVSARHRDGMDWIEPAEGAIADVLRESALRKRDPYRVTSLVKNIDAEGGVGALTGAKELAVEVILATTQAYPRAVMGKLNEVLGEAEERFAAIRQPDDLDGEDQPQTSLSLLRLIAVMGRLEQAVRDLKDDFGNRTRELRLGGAEIGSVEDALDRILASLAQLRTDTRTTVDMIGSTLSSAHLKIARQEARAAAEQRAKHTAEIEERNRAEGEQREREQRLARAIALLASVLLIPTLIASIFGANVDLPRERTPWGAYLMFATMIGLGALSYSLLREFDPTRRAPGWGMRISLMALAAASLGAAIVIALHAFGTG